MSKTVIVLGSTGRLGPAVLASLAARGWRTIGCARHRGDITGFDALDPGWQHPNRWRSTLADVHCAPSDIAGVINLVVGRQHTASRAVPIGTGAVRCTATLAALAETPTTIHLGSVAEFRYGFPSPYAAGKIAARAEARVQKLSVILTVGVVPRPPGDPRDAPLRWCVDRIPAMAALPIDVSIPEEVGDAVAETMTIDWHSPDRTRPVEVTLAGTTQALGDIVGRFGAAAPKHWYSDLLLTILARTPRPRDARLARIVSLARQAARLSESHYNTTPPGKNPVTTPSTAAWRVVSGGESRGLWLMPPTRRGSGEPE